MHVAHIASEIETEMNVARRKSTEKAQRQILLSAFDMHTPTHQNPGAWTDPSDEAINYNTLEYWINTAKLLERGGFDCLFIADVLGLYDVYAGSAEAALRGPAQWPVGDPALTISAMAAATERLCFGITDSLTYELPYAFARKMATLDHLTKGRVAWNIVTSYQQSAAENLGLERQVGHDERYDIADEFMEVCYKLWEGSVEDDAVLRDREKKMFADPEKIHPIGHQGKYYRVPGAFLHEPSPQRTPYLFQAGASARGRKFAAQHAEAVFLVGTNPEDARPVVDLLRMQVAEQGRDPHSVKVIMMLTPIVAPTKAEVEAKLETIVAHGSTESALTLFAGWTGVDLSDAPLDKPLAHFQGDGVRAFNDMLTRVDSELVWTTQKLAEWLCVGGMSATAIGTPVEVVDEMERWIEIADVDGFNLARVTAPGTMEDFVDLVVPELRARGLIPEVPAPPMTLRERFGGGQHLPDDHPGAVFKKGVAQKMARAAEPVTIQLAPRKFGLLAKFEAQAGKEAQVAQWLEDQLKTATDELGTVTWYGFQINERTFGIFDTFDEEVARQVHINGPIPDSLGAITKEMLTGPPVIRQIDLLAVK